MKKAQNIFFYATLLLLISGCATISEMSEMATNSLYEDGVISKEQAQSLHRTNFAITKTFERITPEQEYYIGRSVAATVLARYPISTNAKLNNYINELGQTLALYSLRPQTFKGYRVAAFRSREINAISAPGGLILVSEGLINCCRNESELAAAIAHEIGHVEQKHGLRAIRTNRLASALTITMTEAGNMLTDGEMRELTTAFEESVNEITDTIVNKGYSRNLEFQADQRALNILLQAGYDPHALVSLLQSMRERMPLNAGGFGKTHPRPEDRIIAAQRQLVRIMPQGRELPCRMARFNRAIH